MTDPRDYANRWTRLGVLFDFRGLVCTRVDANKAQRSRQEVGAALVLGIDAEGRTWALYLREGDDLTEALRRFPGSLVGSVLLS